MPTYKQSQKKADVVKYTLVFQHVGLLFDPPPAKGGLQFG